MEYLTNIPESANEYGMSKVLSVRHEVIHLKHVLTEIFVRKSVDIEKELSDIGMSLFEYMEIITNRMRHIHHFSREYRNNPNRIVKDDRDRFFPTIELYKGMKNKIVLDFDGVVTEKSFKDLYNLCVSRCDTVICSANPTVNEDFFIKNGYTMPSKIYSCKGKIKKIKQLIELITKNDNIFYVDNEEKYLRVAWLFGIRTWIYKNKEIKYFTLKTK